MVSSLIKDNRVYVTLEQATLDGSNMRRVMDIAYMLGEKEIRIAFDDGSKRYIPRNGKDADELLQQWDQCNINLARGIGVPLQKDE